MANEIGLIGTLNGDSVRAGERKTSGLRAGTGEILADDSCCLADLVDFLGVMMSSLAGVCVGSGNPLVCSSSDSSSESSSSKACKEA